MQDDKPIQERPAPEVVGSPIHLASAGQDVPWYLPDWGQRLRLMGWRVVYFVPGMVVAGYLLVALFEGFVLGRWRLMQLILNLVQVWKFIFILFALPTCLAISHAMRAVTRRKDLFCIHCGYSLTGLPDHHNCPECGRPYTFATVEEYKRDPEMFIHRHRVALSHPKTQPMIVNNSTGPRRKSRDGT